MLDKLIPAAFLVGGICSLNVILFAMLGVSDVAVILLFAALIAYSASLILILCQVLSQ